MLWNYHGFKNKFMVKMFVFWPEMQSNLLSYQLIRLYLTYTNVTWLAYNAFKRFWQRVFLVGQLSCMITMLDSKGKKCTKHRITGIWPIWPRVKLVLLFLELFYGSGTRIFAKWVRAFRICHNSTCFAEKKTASRPTAKGYSTTPRAKLHKAVMNIDKTNWKL